MYRLPKLASFFLFLILITGSASAILDSNDIELDGTYDYSGDGVSLPNYASVNYTYNVEATVDPDVNELSRVEVKCGDSTIYKEEDEFGIGGTPYSFEFNIPDSGGGSYHINDCITPGQSEYTFEVTATGDAEGSAPGYITTESKGAMNPYMGSFLLASIDSDDNMEFFHLTDDGLGIINDDGIETDTLEDGEVIGLHKDCGTFCTNIDSDWSEFNAPIGASVKPSNSNNLNDLGDGDPDHNTLSAPFDSNMYIEYNFFSLDSMTPAHSGTGFMPDGELMVGKIPEHYDNNQDSIVGGQKKIFVCSENAVMMNGYGEEVPIVLDAGTDGSEDLYKCDQSAQEFESAAQCNSGLDHDGDGGIDHTSSEYHEDDLGSQSADSNCGSKTALETSATCSGVRNMTLTIDYGSGLGTNEEQALISDYEKSDGSCVTDDLSEYDTVDSDSELLHRNWIEPPNTYTLDCSGTNPTDLCSAIETYGNEKVEVVLYYADSEYFGRLAETRDIDITSETVNTKFVTSSGWTARSQTLIQAEKLYDTRSDLGTYDIGQWDERITANVTYDGTEQPAVEVSYGDGKTINDEHKQSWVASNAVGSNTEVGNTKAESESQLFKGGWAGNCDTGRSWQYDSLFTCSGDLAVDQASLLFEDESNAVGSEGRVGLAVMPEIAQTSSPNYLPSEWSTYYGITSIDVNWPSGDQLETLNARCWPGTKGEEETRISNGNYFEATNVPVNTEVPFGIYGTVNFPDTMSDTNFACSWEFETQEDISDIGGVPASDFTSSDGVVSNIGSLVEIHNEAGTEVSKNLTQQHMEGFGGPQTLSSNEFDELITLWQEGMEQAQ